MHHPIISINGVNRLSRVFGETGGLESGESPKNTFASDFDNPLAKRKNLLPPLENIFSQDT
jgi:hypothetical protein